MTELTKPVRRKSFTTAPGRSRRLVVAFEPGDIVAMREERRRTWYRTTVADVYRHAVQDHAWKLIQARRKAKLT